MAKVCEICAKKPITGGREQRTGTRGYLKKRVKRRFQPNLRRVTLETEEGFKRLRICAKCLKRIRREESAREEGSREEGFQKEDSGDLETGQE